MSRPVVVTGAEGFLGRAVTAELRRRTIETIAVSRRALAGTIQVEDYRETPAPPGAVLVHLAEESRIAHVDAAVARTAEQLFVCLLNKNYERVIYSSSGAVYGEASETPHRPSEPTAADSPYLANKLACERRTMAAGGVALRLANVYGPGMRAGIVITDILEQLGGDGPIVLRDGSTIRDFLWIEDAARCFADAATATASAIYNLGTGVGTSIAELARLACTLAGERDRPIAASTPSRRRSCLTLDISATTAAFGWRPEIELAEGLGRLIAER